MDRHQEAIRQAAHALPAGSKRLKSGRTGAISRAYGKTTTQVRRGIERLAKRKDFRRGH